MSLGMQFLLILELISVHFGIQMPPEPVPKRERFCWSKKGRQTKHPKSESKGSVRTLALQTSAPRPPLGGRGVKTYNQHPDSLTRPWAAGPTNLYMSICIYAYMYICIYVYMFISIFLTWLTPTFRRPLRYFIWICLW